LRERRKPQKDSRGNKLNLPLGGERQKKRRRERSNRRAPRRKYIRDPASRSVKGEKLSGMYRRKKKGSVTKRNKSMVKETEEVPAEGTYRKKGWQLAVPERDRERLGTTAHVRKQGTEERKIKEKTKRRREGKYI